MNVSVVVAQKMMNKQAHFACSNNLEMMMMMVVGLYSCKIVLVLKGVSLTTDICLGDNLHTHHFFAWHGIALSGNWDQSGFCSRNKYHHPFSSSDGHAGQNNFFKSLLKVFCIQSSTNFAASQCLTRANLVNFDNKILPKKTLDVVYEQFCLIFFQIQAPGFS